MVKDSMFGLDDLIVGKNYQENEKLILITIQNASIYATRMVDIGDKDDTVRFMSHRNEPVSIKKTDILSVSLEDTFLTSSCGIYHVVDYRKQGKFIKIITKGFNIIDAREIIQKDALNFIITPLNNGEKVLLKRTEIKQMDLLDLEYKEARGETGTLLKSNEIEVNKDYTEEGMIIEVVTPSMNFYFTEISPLDSDENSLTGISEECKPQSVQFRIIEDIDIIPLHKLVGLHQSNLRNPNILKENGVEPNVDYVEQGKGVWVTTVDGSYYFSKMNEVKGDDTVISGIDLYGEYHSLLIRATLGMCVMPLREKYLNEIKERREKDIFYKWGIKKGRLYTEEGKLIQVQLEDNVLVFTNLEPDLEGWVAGRQFLSITTSIPVSKIKSIKIVNIKDSM
ncbi:hypothetical protein ACQUY5_26225 [Bacillus cereus]|uniref:hypothetical protein n=1 Tax=Bacillus cereus TaxID=1396 RepID=UPI003D17E29C